MKLQAAAKRLLFFSVLLAAILRLFKTIEIRSHKLAIRGLSFRPTVAGRWFTSCFYRRDALDTKRNNKLMEIFQKRFLWQVKMIVLGIPPEIWFGRKVLIKN